MKKIIFICILLISNAVFGYGEYESAYKKQQLCESTAGIAEMAYQGKSEGTPSMQWMLDDSDKRTANMPSPFPQLAKEAILRGYKASSRTDAHMAAWSYCMDLMH